MATHKSGGSSSNTTKGNPQYRGLKKHDGQLVRKGNIIMRQCGNKIHGGAGVYQGKDYTLAANRDGIVRFFKRTKRHAQKTRTYVSVIPKNEK
jgi:large subunit ribosomal protein L27